MNGVRARVEEVEGVKIVTVTPPKVRLAVAALLVLLANIDVVELLLPAFREGNDNFAKEKG